MTTHPQDLVSRLRHLVSLNDPKNGGPYQGHAAEQCVQAMRDAISVLSAAPVPEIEAGELVRRLTEQRTVNLADIVQMRTLLDEYSVLHHEAITTILSLSAKLAEVERERDELKDELASPVWPDWAVSITKQLEGYGVEVDPFEGWDLSVDLDDWLSEAIRAQTDRAEAAEASLASARDDALEEAIGALTKKRKAAHFQPTYYVLGDAIEAIRSLKGKQT